MQEGRSFIVERGGADKDNTKMQWKHGGKWCTGPFLLLVCP